MQKLTDSSFLRFFVSGGINTLVTYLLYLLLLRAINYRLAYSIAYVAGIVLAFLLNQRFVFRSHRGLWSMLLFPLVYVAQYLLSLGVAMFWVERLQQQQALVPLIAIVVTVPVTFVLSRAVFGTRHSP